MTSEQRAQPIPLDMYVMLDKSASMMQVVGSSDRWTVVTKALGAFLKQPDTAGVSVGIQYFGLSKPGAVMCPSNCLTDADCGDPTCGPCFISNPGIAGICTGAAGASGNSCDAADYAKPAVEISALPAAANPIIISMKAQKPGGSTPTSAALAGAVQHAKDWAMKNPSHITVVVFATDGDPSECDTSLSNINKIASDGFTGSPKISTYVIGVGNSVSNLNGIAAAGGTGAAFVVDDASASTKLLEAMNTIRSSALACSYQIPNPAMGAPNFDAISVQYTAGGGQKTMLARVTQKSQCMAGTDAWYYDDNAAPTQIILCGDTCAELSKDMAAEIDVRFGCP